jgi:hypothetical protein
VDCGSTPHQHLTEAGSIFCTFGDAGDVFCPTGQQCCLGGSLGKGAGYAPDECAPFGGSCDNPADGGGIPILCNQVSDCVANGVTAATACCLQGASMNAIKGCNFPKYSGGTAIVCEGDGGAPAAGDSGGSAAGECAAGEVQICIEDSDCPAGKTCTYGKWKIYQLGFCM